VAAIRADDEIAVALHDAMAGFAFSVLSLLQRRGRGCGVLYSRSTNWGGAYTLATNKADAGGKGQGS
jgi:hypothetical protein